MTELSIEVVGAREERFAAVPTLMWSLRLVERSGVPVHAVALRAQVRIEPRRRHYDPAEQDRLQPLFGPPPQWGESLNPFFWAHLDAVVPGFEREAIVDVPMACTYDLEVAASRYLHGLQDGEVPVVFLFSGTVFSKGATGFSAEPIAWNVESRYRLAVAVWQAVMDHYFPGTGWLRLQHDTIDRLERYRTTRALVTWDDAMAALLKSAGEDG